MNNDSALLVIFFVEGRGNHCGLVLNHGIFFDLSLIGQREISISDLRFPTDLMNIYGISSVNVHSLREFLQKRQSLTKEIIMREKAQRGWHRFKYAGDYILEFRSKRSKSRVSLNCVEWVLMALEESGLQLPDNILTPHQLDEWSRVFLQPLVKGCSKQELLEFIESEELRNGI